jgi:RNA polymerase sigma-70 factor (ECF subfamily)
MLARVFPLPMSPLSSTRAPEDGSVVVPLLRAADDAALVRGAREKNPAAMTALFDQHAPYVRRVLGSVLGPSIDLADLLQDTFEQAFRSLDRLEQPERLRPWLRTIAVHTARGHLRARRRRSWLSFFAPERLPEPSVSHPAMDPATERAAAVYRVLDAMPEDERVPFCLRWVEELELTECAELAGVSLATVKRKLDRARQRFVSLCASDPSLSHLVASMEVAR